ncbi:uncharacterized protein LOC131649975 [Vicia villosa]|uniref:uncharacterized protein LOC131649975 n=1 Tax=Vicia villosa TaxID=3911 RepID=UPI00273C1448|nr:uncharacterized protein LOC131649975 [Vicia villosa]
MIAQIYVDDIVFGGMLDGMVKHFVSQMQTEFEMSMVGELTYFLRLQIKQMEDSIFLSQRKYVKNIVKKFGMDNASHERTLAPTHLNLSKDEGGTSVDQSLYRSMIGSLLYLTASRPDIAFAVGVCARYQAEPKLADIFTKALDATQFENLRSKSSSICGWCMQAVGSSSACLWGNTPEEVVKKTLKVVEDFWDNLNKREVFLRLKSRQLWLAEGDENTRFFHNSLRDRRRRNSLCSIGTRTGRVEETKEVKDFIFKHFEDFFKEDVHNRPEPRGIKLNSLSIEESLELEVPFFEEEIKNAIWSCDGRKSPGPDDFSLDFFKRFWFLIKEDLMKLCNDFYSKVTLVKAITSSFLTLIPKNKNPQDLFEYRPICLVGSIYKILEKILAERNERCFGHVGRMGFGKKWLKWMDSCIFTSHMSVLVNGLTALTRKSVEVGDFKPFKYGVEDHVDILQFADDTVIIGEPTCDNLWNKKVLLQGFELVSAPSKIIKEIRGLLSNFLWSGNVNQRCIHWVKWMNVCKPKEKGGLGIRDVGEMNKSLLLKWKWRILKEDKAIWSNFLLLRYQNPKIKVLASCKEVLNREDSSWWRDIILNDFKEENSVEGFSDWVVCDFKKGNSILFWHSSWLGDQTLCASFPYLFDLATNKLCAISDVLSWNNGVHFWNFEVLFRSDLAIHGRGSVFKFHMRRLKATLSDIVPNTSASDNYH